MLAALTLLLVLPQGITEERKQLTQGVGELATLGGVPGVMVASGSPSFVVITGAGTEPVFVATHIGKGRALAGGHGAFFGSRQLENESNRKLLNNAFTWLGKAPLNQLTIGTLGGDIPEDYFKKAGIRQLSLSRTNLPETLKQVRIVSMQQNGLDGDLEGQKLIVQFIRDGGGLLINGPAWGWQQLNPGKSLTRDHAGNRMLADYGVGFSGYVADGPFSPNGADNPALTTYGALEALQKRASLSDVRTGVGALDRAVRIMPDNDKSLRTQINALAAKEASGAPPPTLQRPINWDLPFTRIKIGLDISQYDNLGPGAVRKDPTADAFPGTIPPGAKRLQRRVDIDLSKSGWQSTGAYCPPGEVVKVQIPEDAMALGLNVRVGPQTDTLWGSETWNRHPQISQESPLRRTETEIASPFGGLIYIVVPGGRTGITRVSFDNVVAAPQFILGKTTKTDWSMSNASPAPWADLEGKYIALSLPHAAVANLKDPAALMAYWDEVATHCSNLYGTTKPGRPERYCVDRQISNGYMHSGYPIMTHEDVAPTFADVAKLRAKGGQSWGFYHELGHNYQQEDWTWDGCGEVTNNLFSLYGYEMLNGITPETYGIAHPAVEAAEMRKRLTAYVQAGTPYQRWKDDPFLALTMFIQLRVQFGWEPFKKVFAEYRTLSNAERPHSDEQKRDQWMIRFSKAVRKDLGPFFQAWGVPTSATARKSIENFPDWMPLDWPKKE